ncbi:hypothetical protein SOVF_069990 [Spinacia oleracea]|nr:hypothetical protein SOVF_069990 [Spinacia oleracea]
METENSSKPQVTPLKFFILTLLSTLSLSISISFPTYIYIDLLHLIYLPKHLSDATVGHWASVFFVLLLAFVGFYPPFTAAGLLFHAHMADVHNISEDDDELLTYSFRVMYRFYVGFLLWVYFVPVTVVMFVFKHPLLQSSFVFTFGFLGLVFFVEFLRMLSNCFATTTTTATTTDYVNESSKGNKSSWGLVFASLGIGVFYFLIIGGFAIILLELPGRCSVSASILTGVFLFLVLFHFNYGVLSVFVKMLPLPQQPFSNNNNISNNNKNISNNNKNISNNNKNSSNNSSNNNNNKNSSSNNNSNSNSNSNNNNLNEVHDNKNNLNI